MKGITILIVKSKLSTDKDKKLTRKFCKFIESYKNASTKIYIYIDILESLVIQYAS